MKLLTLFLGLILLFSCQNRPFDKDKERINSVCDNCMAIFQKGEIKEALKIIKINSVISQSNIDTLQSRCCPKLSWNLGKKERPDRAGPSLRFLNIELLNFIYGTKG